MKRLSVFLIIIFTICSLTIIAQGYNNRGMYETNGPPFNSINRSAYDSDDSGIVYSDAQTSAHAGLLCHRVTSLSSVNAVRDANLYGQYDVNARLNHDWVDEKRRRDHDANKWNTYLNESANTWDSDNGDFDPSDTIEYCIADCVAFAKDVRKPGIIYSTNCYIPW